MDRYFVGISMKLVSNWKDARRWWSMRFAALGVAVSAAWLAIPSDLAATLPDWARNAVSGVIFGGVLLGRLIDQGGKDGG